ncbi:MAG: hypoxanthine phosphoribosyltransferase [Oscillospiraceae bacterium]|nr:hypoxanthine phosphoribosyltransferase [Oscillospiraceae bacterium]
MQIKELFSRQQIEDRVKEIAGVINEDYKDKKEICIISVLTGSVFFTADLLREIKIPCNLNFLKAKSYQGMCSTGNVNISYGDDIEIEGKDVLLIEDIIDTGITLCALKKYYSTMNPASFKICTFLNKTCRRVENVVPDYEGYEIDDKFVVGYGMDVDGKLRELPYIGYIED